LPQAISLSHSGKRDKGLIPLAIKEVLNKFVKFKEKEGKP